MKIADDVSLEVERTASGINRATVVIAGQPTEARLHGSVLEAAVACRQGWLVFLTDDVPFEEMLQIGFVGRCRRLLDSATIGAMYGTGMFEALRLEPPDTVRFRFFQDAEWSVRLLDRPRLATPFRSDARFAWRGGRILHRFEIDRDPRR